MSARDLFFDIRNARVVILLLHKSYTCFSNNETLKTKELVFHCQTFNAIFN